MNLKHFKKIYNQVCDLEKAGISFDVIIKQDNEWAKGAETALLEPAHFEVTTLKQLSAVQSTLGRTIPLAGTNNKVSLKLKPTDCVKSLADINVELKNNPGARIKYPTLKFASTIGSQQIYGFQISMISAAPTEEVEDNVTYRYIGNTKECLFCINHEHPLYNYLDFGFFFMPIGQGSKQKMIITNELNIDTYLALMLIHLQPDYAKQLQNGCFLNSATAKLMRVKFEKDLKQQGYMYERAKDLVLKDYEKTVNSNTFSRVAEGKIPQTTFNEIKITKTKAAYEFVSIGADDLLPVLQQYVIFGDNTDIYTLVNGYINYAVNKLENHDFPEVVTDDNKNFDVKFEINGINIKMTRTSDNTRRYINDVAINKIELEPVISRASCFTSQAEFDKFVQSVNKMSLKYHDALANGVPMKIAGELNNNDYSRHEAPPAAPRIRFRKVDGDYHLVLGDSAKTVPIKFGDALKKLATLNRRINGGWLGYDKNGYTARYRNHEWGRSELARTLKECCTIEEKELIVDAEGKPVLDETTKKKTYRQKIVHHLTDEDAKFIGEMAKKFHEKAIEKSKVFLASAVKATNATHRQLNGMTGYEVAGKLRRYFIDEKTNIVYNYDPGTGRTKSICIVEPGHQVSVGFDMLATRLYTVANDSMVVKHVTTLTHG